MQRPDQISSLMAANVAAMDRLDQRKASIHFDGPLYIPVEDEEINPTAADLINATRKQAHSRKFTLSDVNPHTTARDYYTEENHTIPRHHNRTRTYSAHHDQGPSTRRMELSKDGPKLKRRTSHDERAIGVRRFVVSVDSTLEALQKQEDSDGNMQITIDDEGLKVFSLGTYGSEGYNRFDIRGNYMISNLLQELSLAKIYGRDSIVLDEARLNENPVNRLSRLIRTEFWENLTRRIDGDNVEIAGRDPKDWTDDPRPRIYVPRGAPEQFDYYTQVAKDRPEIRLDVCWLPHDITPESVKDMNAKPGLLAVEMDEVIDEKTGKKTFQGVPFVVPGGRFNELYGWDSYMETLGLIPSGRVDLAKGMVRNFCFSIKHYGKILNANRSYYLCRSQPPFLTDMALRVYAAIKHEEGAKDFLKTAYLAAIKEYYSVWTASPRLDPKTGLSRYRPEGLGVPPETEPSHFLHVIEPYAEKLGITFEEYVKGYNNGTIKCEELDDYFLHDRAVRESGHDTTYRLEKVCADMATIDLNALLYKYEKDIASVIKTAFNDNFPIPAEFCVNGMKPGHIETSSVWERRAKARRIAMTKYLWNESKGMFMDYNTVTEKQGEYESATTFWALWAGLATPKQAEAMVQIALPKLEMLGGLAAGTLESRGEIGLDRPNRQWDYPYGWAPQQMLAWTGLKRYLYEEEAERLAYKWLHMMTKAFVDFNGVVVEKYNVCEGRSPHKVDAEYGNQGLNFKGVALEGFGWVNASYLQGLEVITKHQERALGTGSDWATFKAAVHVESPPELDSGSQSPVIQGVRD